MKFTVIIPARYASSRLPGKPLVDIAGVSMIERVYRCASLSDATRVIVATDDERVQEHVKQFGGDVCMTSADHVSGTDRLQEVAQKMKFSAEDIVVNVQGDEPLIPAVVINQVAMNLMNAHEASAATLSEPINNIEECFNPNVVKVVRDSTGFALYFSRAPVPWSRDSYNFSERQLTVKGRPLNNSIQRHIGIYAYRTSLLNQFVTWPVSALEEIEKLEQLRILENGKKIHVQQACERVPGGVDTKEDLEAIRELIRA